MKLWIPFWVFVLSGTMSVAGDLESFDFESFLQGQGKTEGIKTVDSMTVTGKASSAVNGVSGVRQEMGTKVSTVESAKEVVGGSGGVSNAVSAQSVSGVESVGAAKAGVSVVSYEMVGSVKMGEAVTSRESVGKVKSDVSLSSETEKMTGAKSGASVTVGTEKVAGIKEGDSVGGNTERIMGAKSGTSVVVETERIGTAKTGISVDVGTVAVEVAKTNVLASEAARVGAASGASLIAEQQPDMKAVASANRLGKDVDRVGKTSFVGDGGKIASVGEIAKANEIPDEFQITGMPHINPQQLDPFLLSKSVEIWEKSPAGVARKKATDAYAVGDIQTAEEASRDFWAALNAGKVRTSLPSGVRDIPLPSDATRPVATPRR